MVPKSVSGDEKKTKKEVKTNEQKSNNSDAPETSEMKDKLNELSDSSAVTKIKLMKNRKKPDCNVQHVLRALNSLTTSEEKLAALCQKYADVFDENRKFQASLKLHEKQLSNVMKERDQLRTDVAKSVLSRSRLENLCRELQRQNREIKEESFQKMREEEEKRKEVSAKFQTTLNEITVLMKEDNDKTIKLRDDNIDMTSKLKSIYEQYEIREQQIEKMAKQMVLDSQLYEARLAKMEMETSAEKEILLREKQQLLVTLTEYQAKFQEYQNIEMALRNQVALYNHKYEEFEKSLTRSNNIFGGFKEETETMSDKIVKLESETVTWKQRWEKTQKALIEIAAEKQNSDKEVVVAAKKMSALHKLCRTLQTERAQLLAKLKLCNSAFTENFSENLVNSLNENEIDRTVEEYKNVSENIKPDTKISTENTTKSKRQHNDQNNVATNSSSDNETENPKANEVDLTRTIQLTNDLSALRIDPSDTEKNEVFVDNYCEIITDDSLKLADPTAFAPNGSLKVKRAKNHNVNILCEENMAFDNKFKVSSVPEGEPSKLVFTNDVLHMPNRQQNDEVVINTVNNCEPNSSKISNIENYVLKEPSSYSSKTKISPKKKHKK